MAFTLEVEFSGLCQYLIHPDGERIGVIMPDGRLANDGLPVNADDFHVTNTHLVNHVGYLRYNLADTGVQVPQMGRRCDTPSFEVIHRFNFEELDFGLDPAPMKQVELYMPDVTKFAPQTRPKPGLFSSTPPEKLLMRTIISGGSLTSDPNGGLWQFDGALHPEGQETSPESFAGSAVWKRRIDAEEVVLRLKAWDGSDKTIVRLRPAANPEANAQSNAQAKDEEKVVQLKIANLCATNPMEWPELFLRNFDGKTDDDFRWFYFLWEDRRGPFKSLLCKDPGKTLPVPEILPAHGDVTNCTGAQQTVDFLREVI